MPLQVGKWLCHIYAPHVLQHPLHLAAYNSTLLHLPSYGCTLASKMTFGCKWVHRKIELPLPQCYVDCNERESLQSAADSKNLPCELLLNWNRGFRYQSATLTVGMGIVTAHHVLMHGVSHGDQTMVSPF